MRKILLCLVLSCIASICLTDSRAEAYPVLASYYGYELAGNLTASGEIFDPEANTCAHRTYEFGTILYLYHDPDPYDAYLGNYSWCRVNDYGPAEWTGRDLDPSYGVAKELGLDDTVYLYGEGVVDIYAVY